MGFFVYILESIKDGHFYIGQTNNINARIERHNKGQVTSTQNRRPLKIIHIESFATRTESTQREKYLKSLKSSKYVLENIIAKQ